MDAGRAFADVYIEERPAEVHPSRTNLCVPCALCGKIKNRVNPVSFDVAQDGERSRTVNPCPNFWNCVHSCPFVVKLFFATNYEQRTMNDKLLHFSILSACGGQTRTYSLPKTPKSQNFFSERSEDRGVVPQRSRAPILKSFT